ncbi:hypothetical protein Adt_29768 [Abeliophyllum distichum]|uniref:Secreted protein n=1 Tax=Abeliophyllum distichum TaxID=126358 RepID=A0ABD1R9B6_9LAMI
MEHSFTHGPLLLGLGHLAACSFHGAQLRSRASPTGTRPPNSLLLPWSTASLMERSPYFFTASSPLPLGLGHLAACSSHGAPFRARATRPAAHINVRPGPCGT